MKWLGMILMTALLIGAPGYGRAEALEGKGASPATQPKVQGEVGSATPSVKAYTAKERQAYQKKAAADLDKLEQRFTDFNNKPLAAPSQKRMKLRMAVSIQKQISIARNRLADLEKASPQEWGAFKAQLDKAMQDLTKNLDGVEAALP